MEEKFTLHLFYMGIISTILAVVFAGIAFYDAFCSRVETDLIRYGETLSSSFEATDYRLPLDEITQEDIRVTLIQPDGTVQYDSIGDVAGMENHLDRPEVQMALEAGNCITHRTSKTSGNEDYYYACLMDNGTILRVSCSASNLLRIYGTAIPYLVIILVALMILAVILAVVMTRQLLIPIKKLPKQMEDPNFQPDQADIYPELLPFISEIQRHRDEKTDMRQEFTANVSHELKTPLTSISGYAELIENGMAKEEDVRRFAGTIRKEAARLLSLISDIIRLSQLDETDGTLPKSPVDLYRIATECRESLLPNAEKRGIILTVTGQNLTILGEEGTLWELVYNLMDNAIRYNRPNGSVAVVVGPDRISVSDTGIGIPQEHQARIFERFYRVDKSHSRATGGTGLGLSIVKHAAERHRAKILLESTIGVGTTMTVVFPLT